MFVIPSEVRRGIFIFTFYSDEISQSFKKESFRNDIVSFLVGLSFLARYDEESLFLRFILMRFLNHPKKTHLEMT